jgi:hypothetical protein
MPFAGKWLRRHEPPRCSLHGVAITPLYRVRIEGASGVRQFCCIRCAASWMARRGERPARIEVTDEASGELIDARDAYFVENSVITNPVTGNRVHAFRNKQDADASARLFAGFICKGGDRPFADFLPEH